MTTAFSEVACKGLPDIIQRVITNNSFSYLTVSSVVLLIALVIYDVIFFALNPDFDSAIWLINPFPLAATLFAIINIPAVLVTVCHIGKRLPLSSFSRNTIRRCCPCSCSTQFHQFILLYCLTNLVVFASFHFQWFIITFLSYPVQVLCSLTYLFPLILYISLLPYMFDVLLSAKKFKRGAVRFALFAVFLLIFVTIIIALYMFASIVLLYSHTAPAWSGVVALLGTGSGGLLLCIIKLASGGSEDSSTSDGRSLSILTPAVSLLKLSEPTDREANKRFRVSATEDFLAHPTPTQSANDTPSSPTMYDSPPQISSNDSPSTFDNNVNDV